jgi:hypothetical protein
MVAWRPDRRKDLKVIYFIAVGLAVLLAAILGCHPASPPAPHQPAQPHTASVTPSGSTLPRDGRPVPAEAQGDLQQVAKYGILELTYSYPTSGLVRPWEQVRVTAQVTSPSSQVLSFDGFYYDTDTHKVRIVPAESGEYSYTVDLVGPSGSQHHAGSFIATSPASKGFIRRAPGSPYRLMFDDGSFFSGIGINDCWGYSDGRPWGVIGDASHEPAGEAGQVDIETYFAKYGAEGGFNLFRYNLQLCGPLIYSALSPAGNIYDLQAAKAVDYTLSVAKAHGFHIMLSFFAGHVRRSWHPTSADNTPEAEAVKRAISYVVARYTRPMTDTSPLRSRGMSTLPLFSAPSIRTGV